MLHPLCKKLSALEPWILAAGIGLTLAPAWMPGFFPSQDGAVHLYNAEVLRTYNTGAGASFREFMTLASPLGSNSLTQNLFSALMNFVSGAAAEKIIISIYLVLFALGFRFLLRRIRPGAEFLTILMLPFSTGWMLHMGFYNFLIATVLYAGCLDTGWRFRQQMPLKAALLLALMLVLSYLAHPLPAGLAILGLFFFHAFRCIAAVFPLPRNGSRRPLNPWDWKTPLAASLPCLLLLLYYARLQGGQKFLGIPEPEAQVSRLLNLVRFSFLESLSPDEALPARILGLITAGLAASLPSSRRFRNSVREWGGWFLFVVFLVWAALATPSQINGGGYVPHRMAFLAAITAFPFIAFGSFSPAFKKRLTFLGLALVLWFFSLHARQYTAIHREFEKRSVCDARMPESKTLLLIPYFTQGADKPLLSYYTQPFRHFGNRLAAARHAVSLSNFSANTTHHPVRFRPGLETFGVLMPQPVYPATGLPYYDIPRYEQVAGKKVETVLITGWNPSLLAQEGPAKTLQILESGYELICRSGDNSVRLYRRR